jgi:phenylalanyl-tRNA synthetase beta chain
MKLSDHWLREWVNPDLSPEELGHALTMAGLELDSLDLAAAAYTGVVVGKVKSVEPHPDADKLRVCQVDDGSGTELQVVCGAPNAATGMLVPFAQVGAQLPGGLKIKKAKLRGVESFGMLCSAKEVGLAESSEGLMALPEDAPLGEDFRQWLDLDDQVYDIDLTPNRADCLSVAGIARETALLTATSLQEVEVEAVAASCEDQLIVSVEDSGACPRYAGRVIRDVNVHSTTPLWMQERLRRSGIRSINPVVDITNYVMLELGQPMHAFDLSKLSNRIIVRQAKDAERLVLLDGQEIEVKSGSLVIADEQGPLALAGVMGGESSSVVAESRDIFLESAFFTPEAIAGRARQYGLHTDSSHRFERGVDPELQVRAIERATQLIISLCGGSAGPVSDIRAEGQGVAVTAIALREQQIPRVLGVSIDREEVQGILTRLGCEVSSKEWGWEVVPPSYRFDIAIEVDLIEEVARVYGYHRIEGTSQTMKVEIARQPEDQLSIERLQNALIDMGYWEAITFTFVDPAMERLMAPELSPVKLANPLSSELAVMRTTLWSGLLKAVQHNLNRQQNRVRLFETGLNFLPDGASIIQEPKLAGVVTGAAFPESWARSEREVDFYDLKGDVENLFSLGAGLKEIRFKPLTDHPSLHPGQSAEIYQGDRLVGVMGALHPSLEKGLDLEQRVYCFELDLASILSANVPNYRENSKFPAIRRDLALVIDESIPAADILASIEKLNISQIQDFYIFDVYTGEGVASGRKSIALGLILQELSRTLNDKEVDEIINKVISQLEKDVNASLRN